MLLYLFSSQAQEVIATKMNLYLLRILVLFGHEKGLRRKLALFIAILAIALVQNSSYANSMLTDSQPPKKSKNIITKANC